MRIYTLSLFALVVCVTASFAEKKDRSAADLLGGDEVIATIRKAEKVEVFRLKDEFTKEKPDDYASSVGPLEVDVMTAQDLAVVVSAYGTYERDAAPACKPLYGLRTRFTKGDSTVDVVYCYACNILTVYHNGKRSGDGYFVPARKDLVRLAQRMLPKDEVIGGLK